MKFVPALIRQGKGNRSAQTVPEQNKWAEIQILYEFQQIFGVIFNGVTEVSGLIAVAGA